MFKDFFDFVPTVFRKSWCFGGGGLAFGKRVAALYLVWGMVPRRSVVGKGSRVVIEHSRAGSGKGRRVGSKGGPSALFTSSPSEDNRRNLYKIVGVRLRGPPASFLSFRMQHF